MVESPNATHRLVSDLNNGISLGEIAENYKRKDQSIDIKRFIEDFAEASKQQNFTFSSLDLFSLRKLNLDEESERVIVKIGLRLIMGKEFEDFVDDAYLQTGHPLSEVSLIVNSLDHIKPSERKKLLSIFSDLYTQTKQKFPFRFVEAACLLSSTSSNSFHILKSLIDLVKVIENNEFKIQLLTYTCLIIHLTHSQCGEVSEEDACDLAITLSQTPPSLIEDFGNEIVSMIRNGDTISTVEKIIRIALFIPPQDRHLGFYDNLKALVKCAGINHILEAIKAVPCEKRAASIHQYITHIKPEQKYSLFLKSLLLVYSLPGNDQLTSHLPESFSKLPLEYNKIVSMILWGCLPKEERTEEKESLILEFINNDSFSNVLKTLNLIPVEVRTPEINNLLIKNRIFIYFSTKKIEHLEAFLNAIPPERIEDILSLLPNIGYQEENKKLPEVRFILANLCNNEEIRTSIHNHLRELFHSTLNPNLQKALANFTLDHVKELKINKETNDLEKRAQWILNDIENYQDESEKNAFATFDMHQIFRLNEKPVEIQTPVREASLNGKTVFLQWDVQKLQKAADEQTYTYADLPQGVSSATLSDLFKAFEDRILQLPENDREQVLQSLIIYDEENNVISDYFSLKSNLLDKPFISGLMKGKGKPHEKVSKNKFYLFSILRAILDQKRTFEKPGDLLTEQESMLFKISESIALCSTGQREGLGIAYTLLDKKYKKGSGAGEETREEVVRKEVKEAVQEAMTYRLSNPHFIQTLDDSEETLKELAHQSTYIKNRISHHIGYQHELEFDPHSYMVANTIYAADAKPLAEEFFDGFDYSNVLAILLRNESLRDLKGSLPQYNAIVNIISEAEGSAANMDNYIQFDEAGNPAQLTEEGTLALLIACYLDVKVPAAAAE